MKKIYVVNLSEEERTFLLQLIRSGEHRARKITRSRILLLADDGRVDREIAEALHTSIPTVQRVRQRFVESGLERALSDRPRKGGTRKLDGKAAAFLVALACSEPPEGRKCWTMQLLADKLVELHVIDSISDETVRRTLKKTMPSPG